MAAERFFKFTFGIFLILVAFYLLASFWWRDFFTLLKGAIPIGLALIGLVFVLLSFEK